MIIDVVDVINIMPLPDINCQTSEFCIDNLSPVKEETIVPQIKSKTQKTAAIPQKWYQTRSAMKR